MAWFRKDKDKDRYYLLPGMGGRNLRRKQKVIIRWTLAAGLVTAGVLAGLLYLLNS
jgi:hypothetical protein